MSDREILLGNGVSPAALSALAAGDLDNFLAASTPGGIERQEKAGQTALVNSTLMPKEMEPSREAFEKIGFKFGAEADDIFVEATLPEGWTRRATDHSMWSEILDAKGRLRVGIFYKAAFYDRRAHAKLRDRYRVEPLYPETDQSIPKGTPIPMVVTDAGQEIHRLGESGYCADFDKQDELYDQGLEWLNVHYPDWRDPTKYWD